MRVQFKTLTRQTFVLDLEETDLVSDVKKKIEAEKGKEFSASSQTLIYSGKVMEDEKTLLHYEVSDKGFIVLMSSTKPAKSSTVPTDKPAEVTTAATQPQSGAATTPSQAEVVSQPSDVPTGNIEVGAGESALVIGEDYERTIQEMVNMGFGRAQVVRALRASFNNPDRAVEYLISGNFPNEADPEHPPSSANLEDTMREPPGDDQSASESAGSDDAISALARLPQFQQMRALVRANPELLPQLLQQIGRDNPELFEHIQSNQAAFLEFLNMPVGTESAEGETTETSETETQPQGGRTIVLTMTHEEREAIDRLKALGFPETLVIQVYYACEKNEEVAANILLSEGPDDDMV